MFLGETSQIPGISVRLPLQGMTFPGGASLSKKGGTTPEEGRSRNTAPFPRPMRCDDPTDTEDTEVEPARPRLPGRLQSLRTLSGR